MHPKMSVSIQDLHDRSFDVIVIGGGINGASAAQNLSAAGYSCLLVDKGDFGSGASGRSSRMLHIGLRFFEARNPVRHFALNPGRFLDALRGARQAVQAVAEHLPTAGDRIWPYRMCFPVYDDAQFKSWHVSAGLKLLSLLSGGKVPLEPETVRRDFADKVPFFGDFRTPERIRSLSLYNEYKFDWPERFCVDMAMDAQRNGAIVKNYCTARIGEQTDAGNWQIELLSSRENGTNPVVVTAPVVLNMAGTWIDQVLPGQSRPLVHATKGAHLIVEMPDVYRGFGIAALNRIGLPFYVLPLHKNLFSIGVTETPFQGDSGDAIATDDEIDFLIEECNHLLPGRALSRRDVLRTWTGVRPLTATSSSAKEGRAPRTLHDLESRGLPGIYALTGGPIMTHRSAGRLALDAVSKRLAPPASGGQIDFTPFSYSETENSPPFLADEPDVRIADLEHAVLHEQARTLEDVLFRRTDLAWRREISPDDALSAAKLIAPHLHWSKTETTAAVDEFVEFQNRTLRRPGTGTTHDNQNQSAGEENHHAP